jgi:hypothetical protein
MVGKVAGRIIGDPSNQVLRCSVRRDLRAAIAAVVVLALSLFVGAAPVAHAQSPAAPPSQFCSVLTPEEVSAALGVTVTISDSTDVDCTYQTDFNSGTFISLNVGFEDSFDLEVMKTVFPDATETTVAGLPALATADSTLLYVSLPNGGSLTLQLIAMSELQGIDISTAMTSLAELAVPRLSSIPLPTAEPDPSVPTFHQDPELEALFPDSVGGQPLEVQSVTGDMVSSIMSNPQTLQQLNDFLASIGKSLADVSVGVGFFTGPPAGSIIAVRIRGTDMASIAPQILPIITAQMTDPQQTAVQVGGKNVTKVNSAGAPDEQAQYLYPRGDVLWTVSTVEPALTEVFGALP